MSVLTSTLKTIGLTAMLAIAGFTTTVYAEDLSEQQARLEALSYAPEGSNLDQRFSQFDLNTDDYAEHELNDSWLGMPAYSKSGDLIGYIENAFVDEDGYVTELAVGLNEQQVIVSIAGDYAELTDENVQIELSNNQIAQLVSTNQLASLQ